MSEPATTAQWLAANPPADTAFKQTLAGVARRALAGESFDIAARELLDELALLQSDEQRRGALAEEPPLIGDPRHDAYLAALGEHFALRFGIDRPPWTTRPERFLDRFWFKSDVSGFRAIAIAQSPAAFRRRGIFIAAGALTRCYMTRGEIVQALTAVGGVLHVRGIEGELYLVGGASFFVEELFASS